MWAFAPCGDMRLYMHALASCIKGWVLLDGNQGEQHQLLVSIHIFLIQSQTSLCLLGSPCRLTCRDSLLSFLSRQCGTLVRRQRGCGDSCSVRDRKGAPRVRSSVVGSTHGGKQLVFFSLVSWRGRRSRSQHGRQRCAGFVVKVLLVLRLGVLVTTTRLLLGHGSRILARQWRNGSLLTWAPRVLRVRDTAPSQLRLW